MILLMRLLRYHRISIQLVNESVYENTNARQNHELRNEFHLSNLCKTTTKALIFDYMKLKGIQNTSHVKVSSLMPPRHRDPCSVSFISFKIDVDDEIASIIKMRDFWPPNSKFKSFVHKRPSLAEFHTQDSNFQCQRQQLGMSRRAN